jgi:RNA polymerase sigma-70 factor (ECF subfamily)
VAEPPRTDIAWLEPIPDALILGADHDPAARYALRESVSLAFIAALQVLPARQRAVLLLRDVLAWNARETAEALGMTIAAANSALHRARSAMRMTHHRTGVDAVDSRPPDDPIVRRLLDAYLRAWEADDVRGLVATMREDVRLAMPPSPSWYDGRTAVESALRTGVFGSFRPAGGFRLQPTAANLAPAFILGGAGQAEPLGLQVLRVVDGTVAEITVFLAPDIAARFERSLPAARS